MSVVHKLYTMLLENISGPDTQLALIHTVVWCIGELGEVCWSLSFVSWADCRLRLCTAWCLSDLCFFSPSIAQYLLQEPPELPRADDTVIPVGPRGVARSEDGVIDTLNEILSCVFHGLK